MPGEDDKDEELDDQQSGDSSPAAGLASLLKRHGDDALSAVTQLYDENFQLRKRIRRLRNDANTGKVPEGAVVLQGADLDTYNSYKQLGTTDEIREKVARIATLEAEAAANVRKATVIEAAQVAKFKPDVLELALGQKSGLSLEVVEEDRNGQKVKVAYAKDGNSRVALPDYASQNWSSLLPALQISGSSSGGTEWPAQRSGGTGAVSNPADDYVNKAYTLPSQRGKK
jgi:hypothetical protein